jgi:hypothetical protein
MLPVVPLENPRTGLQTLRCASKLRNVDAKAAGRIGLADADVFAEVVGAFDSEPAEVITLPISLVQQGKKTA